MSVAMMEQITRAAHAAAASLLPFAVTISGQTVNAVQLDAWESTSELMDGYRKGESVTRVSILKSDFLGAPKEAMKFKAGDYAGATGAVTDGPHYWIVILNGYKQP